MAYFDSEKNKAKWAKRLSQLEQEKNRRRTNGYKPTERNRIAQDLKNGPGRGQEQLPEGVRIITFEELVAKEEARHQTKVREARAAVRKAQLEKGMVRQQPAVSQSASGAKKR